MNALLPPIARELVEILGYRTAMALCRSAGGSAVFVPRRADSDCRLVELIGKGNVAKLIHRFGGKEIKLPNLAAMERADRDAMIRELHAQGVPQVKLALRFGLTPRQVRNIIRA